MVLLCSSEVPTSIMEFFCMENLSHFPHVLTYLIIYLGFPGGTSGKEPACPCRRHKRCGFDSWVRKIPWGRSW